MSRAIVNCRACRQSLHDSLASLAGITKPPRAHLGQRLRARPQTRTLTSSTTTRQQAEPTTEPSSASPPPPPFTETSTSSTPSSLPWYLQIHPPPPPMPISPLLAAQEIPPLPPNAPALLSPLLHHLSVTLGLDSLTLLDLRHLSPPPALGSNLIMIIGTARSIKHLNVSADRCCRWLRSKYKLRPYADGLLGRNELKLKLRRRARRIRLGQVAGRMDGSRNTGVEDEVTTGWVCVNLGVVPEELGVVDAKEGEMGEEEEEQYQNPDEEMDVQNDGYAGFGSANTQPRIVVQMFTEEKRLEMDLEGLWDRRDTKQAIKDEKIEAQISHKLAMSGQKRDDDVINRLARTNIVDVGMQTKPDKLDTEIAEELKREKLEKEGDREKRDKAEKQRQDDERSGDIRRQDQIEKEIDDKDAREGVGEEKPMGGIGAS